MDNNNEMLARAEQRELPAEMVHPNWNLLDRLSPYDQACYMHHQRHRLNHLKALQAHHADDQQVLLLDEAGLVSAVGVPLPTGEQLQRPPPELIYGERAEQKDLEGKTLLLAKQVLCALDQPFWIRHIAWDSLQDLLKADLAFFKTPTALVAAVNEAIREEEAAWDMFPMYDPSSFTVEDATETPIDKILEGICLCVGYRTNEEDDRLELLMGFSELLGEKVLEFHDMYQRLVLHAAENGTNKTKVVILKMERLEVAWQNILGMLTRDSLGPEMNKILRFWEAFSGCTPEGGNVSSRRPQTVNNPNVGLVQAEGNTGTAQITGN
ncbi:hypothetical protein V8C44DRAFT_354993 [Trichoderma aethiopicum]